MIDPAVRIEDVDPVGFAHINELLSRRDRAARTTRTIVHDGELADADVEALRREHGVDELVLLDRRGLDDLSAELVELARQTDDQDVLLTACQEAYRNHWAVKVAPAPGRSRWPEVAAALQRVPDQTWIVADVQSFVLAAFVRGGRIVRISSYLPVEARAAVTLRGTDADLEAVLLADDPLGMLRGRFEVEGDSSWLG